MSEMKATSNTKDVFRQCVGHKIVGVFFGDHRNGFIEDTRTLVLDNGWGLTLSARGAYWMTSPQEVARSVGALQAHLERTQADLQGVIAVAGMITSEGTT